MKIEDESRHDANEKKIVILASDGKNLLSFFSHSSFYPYIVCLQFVFLSVFFDAPSTVIILHVNC